MITGAHAILFTPDAEGVRSFLRDVLGFRSVDAGGGWLIFALPPAELAAHPGEAPGHHELYLMCDDVHATVAELEAKGAEFTRPVSDEGFGLVTAIRLPGGGELGLYEPRHPTPSNEEDRSAYGTYGTVDGRPVLRFERRLAHPVDAVWAAITDPAELAHWFPAAVGGDLRAGGRITFTFPGDEPPAEGDIAELDPPRAFAFSWGDQHLRFELDPADGGRVCLLRFSCVLAERDQAARDAAGWHVCLDLLERHLSGSPAAAPGAEPTPEWRERYAAYAARGLPTGAPVPD